MNSSSGRASEAPRRCAAWLSMVRREWQLSCRGPAFWALLALASVLAAWRAGVPGSTSALAAYQVKQLIVLGVGAVGTFLAGAAAARDRRQAVLEMVVTKPVGVSPGLIVARFLGAAAALLAIAAVMLAAASISQTTLGRTPWRPLAYLAAFEQSLAPLTFACALGFSLSSLFTTPLASGIAAIYWVAVPLARAHILSVFDLTLSQHWPAAALLAGGLIGLSATLYARPLRQVRGEAGRSPLRVHSWQACAGSRTCPVGWATFVLFLAAGIAVVCVLTSGEDALLAADPILMAMSQQSCLEGQRAPGFWLRDARGRFTALSDFSGRPAVLAFWSPAVPESARVLSVLDQVAGEFPDQELAFLAVCLDRDAGTAGSFGREVSDRPGRAGVVVLWDRGHHFGRGTEWSDSPLAVCYDVSEVPAIFLLDRERTCVAQLIGDEGIARLPGSVADLLAEPSPPPADRP